MNIVDMQRNLETKPLAIFKWFENSDLKADRKNAIPYPLDTGLKFNVHKTLRRTCFLPFRKKTYSEPNYRIFYVVKFSIQKIQKSSNSEGMKGFHDTYVISLCHN